MVDSGFNSGFGGGFVANSAANAEFGSPSGASKQSQRRIQSLVPCSCEMLHKAEQDGDRYMIGPIELGQVTIIAKVVGIRPGNSYIEYEVDDDSGATITVKHFVESSDESPQHYEGSQVRVFGSLRTFQNKMNLVSFCIRPVTDPDEIKLHQIEVKHAHVVLTKNAQGGGPVGAAPSSGYVGAPDNMGGLTPLQAQVQRTISSSSSDLGLSIAEVCAAIRGVPEASIRDAIEFLSNEGHIYSTIDDDHYRATDC